MTNIMFRNPADINGREGAVSVDYSWQEYGGSDKNASFHFADFIGGEKNLAFVISANYRRAPRPTYSIQSTGWGQTPQNVWRPTNYTLAWDDLERQREGYDLAVGWKITPKTKVEVRYFYSHFGEPEHQHRLVVTAINPVLNTGGSPVEFNDSGGLVTSTFNRNFYFQYWNQSLQGFTFKGKHEFSDTLRAEAGAARQTNREYYDFDRGYVAAATPVTGGLFRLRVHDEYVSLAPENAAASAAYNGSFSRINSFDNTSSRMDTERENVVYANLTKKLTINSNSYVDVKGGIYFRLRDKEIDRQNPQLTQVPTSNFTFADLRAGTETNYADQGILFGDYYNNAGFNNLLGQNPAAFTPSAQTEFLGFGIGDYQADEDVYAYFLQGTYSHGPFTAIVGARYEYTVEKLLRLSNENRPTNFHENYDHLMPSVHLRYDFMKDFVARASWSNTVGRPDYGDRIYGPVTVNRATSTIVVPNPGLKPLESENYDISVDWYSGPLGLISVGYFWKDIKNFPLATSEPVIYEGLPFTQLSVQAGVTGEIRGWEATFNRRADFLPAPFSGLGVDINYADIDSEIGTPTRPDRPPLDFQPEWILNASLYYAYKKAFIRLALSSKSELIDRNGTNLTNPALDRYQNKYSQWDLSFTYDITRNVQIYGEWRNIGSENERYYMGAPSRPAESKFNGSTYGGGVRWHF